MNSVIRESLGARSRGLRPFVRCAVLAALALGVAAPSGVATGQAVPGDANGDGVVTVLDVFFTINYLFAAGPAPISSGAPSPVPRTGQTTSYATGDDGDLERGVAWPAPRFTDNGNGTVTDKLTGLIWLKNANCANAAASWQVALDLVAELNATGMMNSNSCADTSNAGSHQTDWRLPNAREMVTLVDYGRSTFPVLPAGSPFTNTGAHGGDYYYWTSTTAGFNSDWAWLVRMGDAELLPDVKTRSVWLNGAGGTYHATAVRGGP